MCIYVLLTVAFKSTDETSNKFSSLHYHQLDNDVIKAELASKTANADARIHY